MAASTSPVRSDSVKTKAWELKQRLHQCWELSLDWNLYPEHIKLGCQQIGKAIDMPPDAILSGLLLLISFFMSHCVVKVPGTVWVEPVILWIAITMPTGSGKTPLFAFLTGILHDVRKKLKLTSMHPPWLLDEASFEKMGELMATNHSKLLGMYDELSTFLAQINVYRGKGLSDSHDLSTFLSLYTGKSWTRATVSGDANFHMERTALTVGGFTQPTVAKSLIELPASVEKGLTQRFLWIFPEPSFASFDSLELIDERFTEYLVDRLASLWRANDKEVMTLTIPEDCEDFKSYYDALQEKISQLSVLDELLSGMLSKAKGQVLRVAAAMNVLFNDSSNEDGNISVSSVPSTISTESIVAAQNFVDLCCQHAAYIAGRGKVEDEISKVTSASNTAPTASSVAAYCLLLPGKTLYLSALLAAKKFRNRGNKPAALGAFHELEEAGLGKIDTEERSRGAATAYTFVKEPVGDDLDGLVTKLARFGVSLTQYQHAMRLEEIRPALHIAGTKRPNDDLPMTPRRSPRKHGQ